VDIAGELESRGRVQDGVGGLRGDGVAVVRGEGRGWHDAGGPEVGAEGAGGYLERKVSWWLVWFGGSVVRLKVGLIL